MKRLGVLILLGVAGVAALQADPFPQPSGSPLANDATLGVQIDQPAPGSDAEVLSGNVARVSGRTSDLLKAPQSFVLEVPAGGTPVCLKDRNPNEAPYSGATYSIEILPRNGSLFTAGGGPGCYQVTMPAGTVQKDFAIYSMAAAERPEPKRYGVIKLQKLGAY